MKQSSGTSNRMKQLWLYCVAQAIVCAAAQRAVADDLSPAFEIYGAVQADYIQDFDRVNSDWTATLRPSKIAVPSGEFGSDGQAIISARQSKFGVKAALPVDGDELRIKFDFDLFGVGNNAGQTTFRLQNAYGQWRQILAGQTDTTFMDLSIFPDTIDYWGPPGMVFVRNAQIRWTPISGPNTLAVAIETPNTDIDLGNAREIDPGLAANLQADNKVPDLTTHFRADRDWGHVQIAGILRRLGYDTAATPGNNPSGDVTGWGVNLTSNVKSVGQDLVHLGVVYGHGIASYMNDGGTDMAPECRVAGGVCVPGTVSPAAVPLLGVMAYYDHYWNEKFSTAFGYSQTRVDNQSGQENVAFHSGQYASANLLWRPAKNFMVGAEGLWGKLEQNSGQNGTDARLQITVQYKFSSKDFNFMKAN